MRTLVAIVLGMVAGFLAGIVANELLAMLGLLVVDDVSHLRALRFLPGVLALAGAVAGPMVDARRPR